ncbi:unnamed protein product [Penicillium salamii]|uniref:ferric-chelate reductase (NADPH) n=1 Tax=Penicillium salamii TaxID=1612424 RepID=A0A9W4IIC7_9EURO|nr:unnamed protein product [Penicillium salamii]CAG8011016.1 unnamed protein product [Penicillium salamii]CAG8068514.1 unnamed protein product [Penicillium salamii]CAG8252154.1 unnamed protein product [Penicillium salamii]CAG8311023.1 unnamed protein product [Penicillium salamii]
MQMSGAMKMVPFLDQPVMLHSSRDPGKCTMTPEQCAYKFSYWVFWYEADHRYALPTVAFFLVAIILFTISRLISKVTPQGLKRKSLWSRLVAGLRFISYKSWNIWGWNTHSLGTYMLAAAGAVFFLAMTLGPHPYYWPNTKEISYGGSPPIATRAGFMALACLPFLIVLGAKANPITALTGISHEKLNIWHNWVAWAMFVLALVHTFPFIIVHIEKGDLVETWNTGGVWVTGVVALIAQAWLTFMSIPWIRNRYYEFFKATHLFMALAFIIFFFLHCDFRMSSWDYFIATAVIYTMCFLYSQCKTYIEHGFRHKASLVPETNDTLKVTIDTKMTWAPGQHIFIRFLTCGVHAFTAHPFTICSVPQKDNKNQLVFYVKHRGGLTGRLMKLAEKNPGVQIPVMLDGPYGGIPDKHIDQFDKSLIVGGGAGAGFTLSLLENFIYLTSFVGYKAEMKVVVATRDPGMRAWFTQAVEDIAARHSRSGVIDGLSIDIHETHHEQGSDTALDTLVHHPKSEKDTSETGEERSTAEMLGIRFLTGRPDLPTLTREFASQRESSVAVVVCGPASMNYDVSEAAAAAQRRILAQGDCAREVWLHTESFSY